jgi:patatin-like phospholipase/acyl hydrolase
VTTAATIKGEGLRVEPAVRLIRSYEDPTEKSSPPWTVLDAALATTAAPALFRNHTITHENVTYQFEDAGVHGLSNPTIIAWDECDRIDPKTLPYCIVSLGTGLSRNPTIETDKPASYWLLAAVLAYMPFTGATGSQKASANRDARNIDEKMIRLTRKMDPK